MYWALRIGFANPLMPIVSSVGLALLFINVPVLVSSSLQRGEQRSAWHRSYSFVCLVTLARWIRRTTMGRALLLVLLSGFFATWAGGVVWGRIYKSPLFLETL